MKSLFIKDLCQSAELDPDGLQAVRGGIAVGEPNPSGGMPRLPTLPELPAMPQWPACPANVFPSPIDIPGGSGSMPSPRYTPM